MPRRPYRPTRRPRPHVYLPGPTPGVCLSCPLPQRNAVHVAPVVAGLDAAQRAAGERERAA
jgi:hypothetical protein